ncbi:MAG: M48 family metalloprotease, partial [Polyangiaceae bacterium]
MAKVGNLDFRAYVDAKEAQTNHDNTVERAYAYVSDRHTRATFDKIKPVELAVSSAVRLMRQVGRSELLGTAVKVGPQQFPRVHEIATHCADTLGIAPPALYIRNNPTINAMTYGTNDDAFVLVHSALVDHFSDEELLTVIGH